ncbi:MAG: twitching motility protein PilT [Polaromonas sp.]|nr:twitching motility protein PilT [Polaromonas sp.]
MSRYFVIDTNVVVAGLLASRPDSPVARILDGMLAATFSFVLSEPLLAEYRTVLLRPHLSKLHGLSEAEVDTVLQELAQHAIVLTTPDPTQQRAAPSAPPLAPDPGDQFLWDLLATRADLVLVTGDKRLLATPDMASRTMLPTTFVTAELGH